MLIHVTMEFVEQFDEIADVSDHKYTSLPASAARRYRVPSAPDAAEWN
jgi:hypothetical protein